MDMTTLEMTAEIPAKESNEPVVKYDASEMDGVKSPPLLMISLFIGVTAITILYVFGWSILLSP